MQKESQEALKQKPATLIADAAGYAFSETCISIPLLLDNNLVVVITSLNTDLPVGKHNNPRHSKGLVLIMKHHINHVNTEIESQ